MIPTRLKPAPGEGRGVTRGFMLSLFLHAVAAVVIGIIGSRLTVVDDKHFEFRRDDDGTVASLVTWEGLDYVFLKKDGGYEKRTRDILIPSVRVSVDYTQERGKQPVSVNRARLRGGSASKLSRA